VAGQLAQELADELGGLRVQGGAAQVDVVVGLLAGGEGDFAVDDGELLDELSESRSGDAVDGGGFLGHGTRSFRRRGSKLCCSLSYRRKNKTHPVGLAFSEGSLGGLPRGRVRPR